MKKNVNKQKCNEENIKYAEQFTTFRKSGTCEECGKKEVALTDDDGRFICADCVAELIRKL